jgi:hypothetical protein
MITKADTEFKEAKLKQEKFRKNQKNLTDQIEQLKLDKGLNKAGLNKDALIGKMKVQIEQLLCTKKQYEKELGICRR